MLEFSWPFPFRLSSRVLRFLRLLSSSSSRTHFFDLPHSAMAGNVPGIGRIILLVLLLLRVRTLEVWFFSPTGRWSVATGARSFLSRFVPGPVSAAVAATAGGIDALLRSAFFAVLLLLLLLSSGGPTGMSVLLLFWFLILFCFCVFTPASATFQHLIYRYAFACQLCRCWGLLFALRRVSGDLYYDCSSRRSVVAHLNLQQLFEDNWAILTSSNLLWDPLSDFCVRCVCSYPRTDCSNVCEEEAAFIIISSSSWKINSPVQLVTDPLSILLMLAGCRAQITISLCTNWRPSRWWVWLLLFEAIGFSAADASPILQVKSTSFYCWSEHIVLNVALQHPWKCNACGRSNICCRYGSLEELLRVVSLDRKSGTRHTPPRTNQNGICNLTKTGTIGALLRLITWIVSLHWPS